MGQRTVALVALLISLIVAQAGAAKGFDGSSNKDQKPLRIAVAANFKPVLDELIEHHPDASRITVSTGSTGALTAQVRNGAPYDLLFAADVRRPEYLENLGLTRTRKTYAFGRLALWQPNASSVNESSLGALSTPIAIANPRHAPYGQAAEDVLQKAGNTRSRRIKGSNVAQAFSFVQTGNVDAGLVALSQLRYTDVADHTYWIIPADFHLPIEQQAVVIRGADDRADAFLQFMDSAAARTVIERAGYDLVARHD